MPFGFAILFALAIAVAFANTAVRVEFAGNSFAAIPFKVSPATTL
jgi:hypothetical protein